MNEARAALIARHGRDLQAFFGVATSTLTNVQLAMWAGWRERSLAALLSITQDQQGSSPR